MEEALPRRSERMTRLRFDRLRPLGRSFYARDARLVATRVLGKIIVARSPRGVTAGRIVETEAYLGPEDRAAHSFGGRRTPRTEAMFGPAGYAYIFMIYGMHFHFNLVTASVAKPQAVLVRAIEPLVGRDLMSVRRCVAEERLELTNGPGKLCQALGIDRRHYGVDLTLRESPLTVVEGRPPEAVGISARIGVEYAGAWAKRPYRFFDRESAYVSTARPRRRAS